MEFTIQQFVWEFVIKLFQDFLSSFIIWIFASYIHAGGPMSSGLPNEEKANVRKAFAKGEVSREELIKAESKAYHGKGTCTFYGTANLTK